MAIGIPESINGPQDDTSDVNDIDFSYVDVDAAYRTGGKNSSSTQDMSEDETIAPMEKSFPVENISSVEETQPYTGVAYTAGADLSHTGSSVDFGQRPKLLGSADDAVYHPSHPSSRHGVSSVSPEAQELQETIAQASDIDDIGFDESDVLAYEAETGESSSATGSIGGGDSAAGSSGDSDAHGDGIDLESVDRKPLPGMSASSVQEESSGTQDRVVKKRVGESSSNQSDTAGTTTSESSSTQQGSQGSGQVQKKPQKGVSKKETEEQAIKNLRSSARQHRSEYQDEVRKEKLFGQGLTPAERKKRIQGAHNKYAANMVRSCLTPLTENQSLASGIMGAVGMSVMLWCISPKFRAEVGSHLPNIKNSINDSAHNISNAIMSKGFWGNSAAHQRAKQSAAEFKENLSARIKDTLGGRLAMSEESAVMTRVSVAENAYGAMREEGADSKAIMAEYKETVADLEREWVEQKLDIQDINAGARRLVGERVRKDPSYAALFDNTAYGHFTPTKPNLRSFKDAEQGMVAKPVYDGGWENSEGHKIVKKSTFFTPREPIVGENIKDHALFTADVIRKDVIKVIDNGTVEDLKNAVVGYFAAENVYKTHRDELALCRYSSPIAQASGRIHNMLDAARSDGLSDEEIGTLANEAINNALGCVGKEGDKYMKAMENFDATYGTTWYTEDVAAYSKDPLGYVTRVHPEAADDLALSQGVQPVSTPQKSGVVEVVVGDDAVDAPAEQTETQAASESATLQGSVDTSYIIDTSQLSPTPQAQGPSQTTPAPDAAAVQSPETPVDNLAGDDPTLQAQAISLTQSGGLSASYGDQVIIDASHSTPVGGSMIPGQHGSFISDGPQPGMGDGHIGSAAQINVREPYGPVDHSEPYSREQRRIAEAAADQQGQSVGAGTEGQDQRRDADGQGPDNNVAVNYDTEQQSRPDVQREDLLDREGLIEGLSQVGDNESARTLSRDSNKLSTSEKTARKVIRMRQAEALELEERLRDAEPGSEAYKEASERLAEISELTPREFDNETQGAINAVQMGQIDQYQPQRGGPDMDY